LKNPSSAFIPTAKARQVPMQEKAAVDVDAIDLTNQPKYKGVFQ
jgi:hypothetical protein